MRDPVQDEVRAFTVITTLLGEAGETPDPAHLAMFSNTMMGGSLRMDLQELIWLRFTEAVSEAAPQVGAHMVENVRPGPLPARAAALAFAVASAGSGFSEAVDEAAKQNALRNAAEHETTEAADE